MSGVALRAENLGKRYRIGQRAYVAETLRDVLTTSVVTSMQKWFRKGSVQNQDEWIWALRDVTFQVGDGEAIGIIGRNGAGKSTLLKILSRVTEPSQGTATIVGRIGSLLEVGTGFHPELTGRENIYLNGAILGMHRAEITRQFDEIVAFAEIEQFIDTPVKRYSSGMYMRLAFGVAAHLQADILMVDEVLAVGDVAFQKKCLGKMGEVAKNGRTVLFVSHNIGAISRLCQRVLWLDRGGLMAYDDTEKVVAQYLTSNASAQGELIWPEGIANPGINELALRAVRVFNSTGETTLNLDVRKTAYVEIQYNINQVLPYCRVGLLLSTLDGTVVFESYDADDEWNAGQRQPGKYMARCELPANLLNPGSYILSVNAGMPNIKNLAFLDGLMILNIEDTGAVGSHLHSKRSGVIRPKLKWTCEEIKDATANHR